MSDINTKKKRKHKKSQRRIHRGRLSLVLSFVAIVVVIIMVFLSRYSDDAGTVFRAGADFRKPIPTAIEAGKIDAGKVLKTAPGSMERDKALLYIKSKESRLRMSGYSHAADDYIQTANDILHKNNIF